MLSRRNVNTTSLLVTRCSTLQSSPRPNGGSYQTNDLQFKRTDVSIRWDDDVVFRNQARGTENKGKKEFVNVSGRLNMADVIELSHSWCDLRICSVLIFTNVLW